MFFKQSPPTLEKTCFLYCLIQKREGPPQPTSWHPLCSVPVVPAATHPAPTVGLTGCWVTHTDMASAVWPAPSLVLSAENGRALSDPSVPLPGVFHGSQLSSLAWPCLPLSIFPAGHSPPPQGDTQAVSVPATVTLSGQAQVAQCQWLPTAPDTEAGVGHIPHLCTWPHPQVKESARSWTSTCSPTVIEVVGGGKTRVGQGWRWPGQAASEGRSGCLSSRAEWTVSGRCPHWPQACPGTAADLSPRSCPHHAVSFCIVSHHSPARYSDHFCLRSQTSVRDGSSLALSRKTLIPPCDRMCTGHGVACLWRVPQASEPSPAPPPHPNRLVSARPGFPHSNGAVPCGVAIRSEKQREQST